MKKQFLNLGKALNKAEQKLIFGGVHELAIAGDEPGQRCDGNYPSCSEGEICCGAPGGAQYCQNTPCY
jgi:hypothetical protein